MVGAPDDNIYRRPVCRPTAPSGEESARSKAMATSGSWDGDPHDPLYVRCGAIDPPPRVVAPTAAGLCSTRTAGAAAISTRRHPPARAARSCCSSLRLERVGLVGDGLFISYQRLDSQTAGDIWMLPLEGDRKPWVFLNSAFDERRANFSPDGRWVAYPTNRGRMKGMCYCFGDRAARGRVRDHGRSVSPLGARRQGALRSCTRTVR